MKFILHRDPSNKLQKIPLLAMQLSGLVDAQELIVHVDEGCIGASAGHCAFQECNHRQPLTSDKRRKPRMPRINPQTSVRKYTIAAQTKTCSRRSFCDNCTFCP